MALIQRMTARILRACAARTEEPLNADDVTSLVRAGVCHRPRNLFASAPDRDVGSDRNCSLQPDTQASVRSVFEAPGRYPWRTLFVGPQDIDTRH